MTIKEIENLIQILRTNGVKYFKSDEVEIKLEAVVPATTQVVASVSPESRPETKANSRKQKQENRTLGDVPIKEMQIPHQINEMVSVLKMSPEDLVDKLFPEGVQ